MRRGPDRGDRGSIAIEYLGILPLILVVAFLILQGLTVVVVRTAAEDAARAAARAVTRGDDPAAAARESLPAWLDDRVSSLDVSRDGSLVLVTIELSVPQVVGGLGSGTQTGRATFEAG